MVTLDNDTDFAAQITLGTVQSTFNPLRVFPPGIIPILISDYCQCADAGGDQDGSRAHSPLHDGYGGSTGVVPALLGTTLQSRTVTDILCIQSNEIYLVNNIKPRYYLNEERVGVNVAMRHSNTYHNIPSHSLTSQSQSDN